MIEIIVYIVVMLLFLALAYIADTKFETALFLVGVLLVLTIALI